MNVIIIRYNTLHEHILVNGIYVNHTTIRYNIKYTLYFSKTVHCKYDSTQVLVYVKKIILGIIISHGILFRITLSTPFPELKSFSLSIQAYVMMFYIRKKDININYTTFCIYSQNKWYIIYNLTSNVQLFLFFF